MTATSAKYDWKWDREEETFDTGVFRFNITRAKRIIKAAPRPVLRVAIAPYVAMLEMLVDLVPSKRTYDLDFPIIIATSKRGGTVVIDGWHRVDAANKKGLSELPAVFLTIEETKVVRRA